MSLSPGTRFGPYEITEEIGAGGMGVVHRARDSDLDREVAIKVLPASMVDDAERLTRFDREAKTLASLNHPNIGQIYGIEKSEGTTALVLELVEGPTLAERIEQGPLSADETMQIAMQIAAALEAAHSQGIVHRDLKPANVKLKPDGTVKVLDFGIAKAMQSDVLTSVPQSPILTTPATQVGVILGTAAYMSPEQAKGQPVDQRADIWAFGCLLYEMLTGQMAFGAEDVPTTLARVIANETDLDSLPGVISPAVRHTIALCLQKDPSKRLHAMGDVRLALEGAFETVSPQAAEAVAATQPIWRRPLPIALVSLSVGGVIVGLTGDMLRPEPEPSPVSRFDYELPDGQEFRNTGRRILAISPDGRQFVYNSADGLYLRALDELEARLIPGTEPILTAPSFSPDGQALAYWDLPSRQLKRTAISGGAPVLIADVSDNVNGLSWAADGTIFFGQREGIMRVPATGGSPELIIPAEDGNTVYGPQLLPDGDTVLFSVGPQGSWDAARVVAQSLSTGEQIVLVEGGNDARYLPTGHLIYALEAGLFGVVFDLDTLTVSGGAVPLVQGVMRAGTGQTGVAHYSVAENGTLIYGSGAGSLNVTTLLWRYRDGREELLGLTPRALEWVRVSPDGSRLAFSVFQTGASSDVWIYDLARGIPTRLTFEEARDSYPLWTPDSERVVYYSDRGGGGLFWQAADGTGRVEQLTTRSASGEFHVPTSILSDGSELIYFTQGPVSSDLYALSLTNEPASRPLLESEFDEDGAEVSPDGRWIAYVNDESGIDEVYVRPYPNIDDGKWQVSTDGGAAVRWGPDGRELYYLDGGALMMLSVEAGESVSPGLPVELFTENIAGFLGGYDVAPDGQRILVNRLGDTEPAAQRIVIVENWFDEVRRLAPTE